MKLSLASLGRRLALGAALSALGIAALGTGPAAAQEKLTVRFDFLPYGSHAPFYLAQEKGWFKEQGVDPTFDDGNGGAVAVQLVDAGKYDLAYVSFPSAMVARDKGIPVKAIAGVLRKSDLGVLISETSTMKTPKDFEGKTIYFSPNSVETAFIDMWFKKNGVDKSKVTLTALDVGVKVSTYLAGGGDGMFVPVPIYTIRQNIPRLSKGIMFADYGLPLPGFGVISSDATIKAKPKQLAGFVAALQKAWAGIHDRTLIDEAVAAILKNRPQAKLDPIYIKQQLEAVIPFMDSPGTVGKPLFWQSPDDWAAGIAVSVEAGVIKNAKPEEFFTNDFIPKAP